MASYYQPDWASGTITLTSGSTAFTVADADLVAIGVQPGDEIYHTATGRWLIIDEVTSSTTGNLAYACPADLAGAGLPLRIRFQPDGSRFAAAYLNVLQKFKGGNLDALAGLTGATDKLPYFTGAGTMDLSDLTEAARLFLGGGYLQVKNGANAYLNVAAVAADYALIEAIKSDGSKGDLRLAEYGGGVFINSFKAWHDGNASFLVNSNGIAAKLPNGFIAQAGFASFNTSGYVNITFPTAFPTAVSDIQTGITANYTSDVLYTAYPAYGLVSTTGTQVYGRKFSGGTVSVISNEGYLYWSASGY